MFLRSHQPHKPSYRLTRRHNFLVRVLGGRQVVGPLLTCMFHIAEEMCEAPSRSADEIPQYTCSRQNK